MSPRSVKRNKGKNGRARLIPRGKEDKFVITKIGRRNLRWIDFYVRLLAASWQQLIFLFVLSFISINSLFATIYCFLENGIENARAGTFLDYFFFSVQTMSTVGYGKMVPVTVFANVVVTIEIMIGILFIAVVTGLVFSKFSRPTARVLFSNIAVIQKYYSKPHLMFRLANERDNRIVEARLEAVLLKKETSPEGHQTRRFYDLHLLRHRVPILQLSWTIMHPIDERSPLYGVTMETLKEWDAEIIVSLSGIDETFSQTIYARHSYIADDIIYGASFVDVIKRREEDNGIEVDLNLFHDIRHIE